jgi:hypothetical protein
MVICLRREDAIMVELSRNLLMASLPGASYWLLGLVLLPI